MKEHPSNSVNSSASVTSKPPLKYVCKHCFKNFRNSHALAGHYNAHSPRKVSKLTIDVVHIKPSSALVVRHPSPPPPPPPPPTPVESECESPKPLAVVKPTTTQEGRGFPRRLVEVKTIARTIHRQRGRHPYSVKEEEKGNADFNKTLNVVVAQELDLELRLGLLGCYNSRKN